jgi:molybdopterin-guanine dinucleotide biosynthesis protein A
VAARAAAVPLTHDASLVVLAGGRSTRMGRPKSELPVGGVTLLEWIVARLGPAFAETIVAGAPAPSGAREVQDRRVDVGPLGGIEAALAAMRTDRGFVLACDMPRATVRLAAMLLERAIGHDAAVPRLGGRAQPTCAAYARGAGAKLSPYLDGGGRRATAALAVLDVRFIEDAELAGEGISPRELEDLDTPANYDAFIASIRS